MKIITNLNEFKQKSSYLAVALGNFDGVHIGHQHLLAEIVASAKANAGEAMVFTFAPHPKSLFSNVPLKLLNTEAEKVENIAKTGADLMLNFDFNLQSAAQEPEDFFREVLVEKLQVDFLVVGFNYHFGKGGRGDAKLLAELAAQHGVQLKVMPAYTLGDEVVSSSLIRQKLENGEVQAANQLLGYEYCLSGEVVHGKQIGRTIGFPTANVDATEVMQLPKFGVYAAYAICEGVTYKAVVNVGLRPTVADNLVPTIEAHCLDTDMDFYGKIMEVHFVSEIRYEQKFNGLEQLKAQIACDAQSARDILG